MKVTFLIILSCGFFILSACTVFYPKQSDPASVVQSPKPLTLPVGKNWQVVEEPPKISDGSRLPFQTEQSVQPPGAKPATPVDNRTIETSQ